MTRYERRQLRRIERWFEHTDPALASVLAGRDPTVTATRRRSVLVWVTVLGFAFLLGGAVVHLPLVFAGFLLLMTAACMHVTRLRSAGTQD
ncbi:DUF3040 domain-containing protein [Actinosynnema sp. NPDC047251]|uniref:Uncharacterized protein n=1 Tax=Saccharothrix espanaensis (strain ATCC 51144 / DSM 44229 / JCM 9112 / NBRC 15066 / NRRL 15764) TaxID=1179773 RepID=K0K2T8_SACES|nr:DUF3040 domain-containing protein [Saccharothrix espanaensis]CCH32586.1 hypothetical protein BN6_53220 [Saccharothrix espanaensis DSM 44229]